MYGVVVICNGGENYGLESILVVLIFVFFLFGLISSNYSLCDKCLFNHRYF